jgi:hypothetical protein
MRHHGHGPEAGEPPTRRTRRPYDPAEREIAAQIQDNRPRWLVLWGVASRRYWAFPLFNTEPGTIVSAIGPRELIALLDQAEAAASLGGAPRRAVGQGNN